MGIKIATPKDLAEKVFKKLNDERFSSKIPNVNILEELFTNLFYTSIQTEEGQFIKMTATFINPKKPDPNPEELPPAYKWSAIPFKKSIKCTVKNLSKLAKAVDPWSSSLAIYFDSSFNLVIWGMIDQAIHYQSFLNYEIGNDTDQPGIFQVSITSVGCLTVMNRYELIATLKQDTLISNYVDIFRNGQVYSLIKRFTQSNRSIINKFISEHFKTVDRNYWNYQSEISWIETFSRILIKIQNYQHGGAILIPVSPEIDLTIKHPIEYTRLNKARLNLTKAYIENLHTTELITNEYFVGVEKKENMPTDLYLSETISDNQIKTVESELKGAIRFISSLSCIDGLIVMSPELDVWGFGAIINTKEPPSVVYISKVAKISANTRLAELNTDHFGTRHRSMFAYCWKHPGSLGFVISQDGDIRVVTKLGAKLIMWENIRVQQFIETIKYKRNQSPSPESYKYVG